MSTRRKYTKEFKLDAISLVTEQGYSNPEAAKSLGINPNMLSRWIRCCRLEICRLQIEYDLRKMAFELVK